MPVPASPSPARAQPRSDTGQGPRTTVVGCTAPEPPPACVASRDEDGGMLDTCRGEMFVLVVTLWRTLINYFEESPFLTHTKRDLGC